MKVINLFGAPSVGKSTIASGLFHYMKCEGFNVELVTEVAKDLVWQKSIHRLKDQAYIFGLQNHKLFNLRGQVDWVISDAPILLSAIYAPDWYPKSFTQLTLDIHDTYNNMNYLITKDSKYTTVGRVQDEEESDTIATRLKLFLVNNFVEHREILSCSSAIDAISEDIK